MMKKITTILLTMAFFVTGLMLSPEQVAAAPIRESVDNSCAKGILGFRPWYQGIVTKKEGKCVVGTPKDSENGMATFVWSIVLNVLIDLFSATGYVAVIFIIYGGVKYIMSQGDPGNVAKAKQILTSAAIGVGIALLASVVVNTIIQVISN